MAKECKEGEFTLIYNSGDCGYVTALTSLGNIEVVKQIKVKYEKE